MAGIGFELRRMLQKESLGGQVQAYVFSAIIGSGPWVLSMFAILAIGLLNAGPDGSSAFVGEFQISITYLMASSLILSGLLQLVFTRFVADLLYEHQNERIVGNLFGALMLSCVVAGLIGTVVAVAWLKGSVLYRVGMVAGLVVLCGVWMAVIFASAIKAYKKILWVFLVGYTVSVGGAYSLGGFGLEGLVWGFVAGQAVLFFALLALAVQEYPGDPMVSFTFLDRQQIYPSLIWVGLLYNLGVWVDKFLFWAHPITGIDVVGTLRASPVYDFPVFLSYLSLIPGMAVFLIRMETDFSEKCERFYATIEEGGTLAQVHEARRALVESVRSGLLQVVKVQGATAVALMILADDLLTAFGLATVDRSILNICLASAAVQLVMLSVMNVFHYLDQRHAALWLCGVFAVLNAGFTWLTLKLGPAYYGAGLALAVGATTCLGLYILWRKLDRLEYETFMLQPAVS